MPIISDENLKKHTNSVKSLDGDFAEIGVFCGQTFKRLVPLAGTQNKKAHGFDSFIGMDEPTDLDFGQYNKGRLSCGGILSFTNIMNSSGIDHDAYNLYEGFIPICFNGIPKTQKYSFALIDVDQYAPTVTALPWIWDKLVEGGVLVMDDYFKNREGLASKAIDEWLRTLHPLDFQFIEYTNRQLVIKKQYFRDCPFSVKEK